MKLMDGLHCFLWSSMQINNCNTYFIDGPTRILIDPGHLQLFDHVEAGLRKIGVSLPDIDLVLATHCHPDHMEAVKLFKKTGALFAINQKDWQLIKEMGSFLGISLQIDDYLPDFFLEEGELKVRDLRFQIYHTPGHSPGSVGIYWPRNKTLFTGDVIFKEGLGRTDLPGGNGQLLKESIKSLAGLDVELLLPGHGELVSGKRQVKATFEHTEHFWFNFI